MEERNKQEPLFCKVATTEKTNVCASPRARLTRATSVSAVMCSRPFELWADTRSARGNMLNKVRLFGTVGMAPCGYML